ncbi:membrane protein [Yersinia entomophaga]|uniref:Membrane protein n=1 Tax=Yersinia entomophaga TaxID=935293 RepID=A0ABM6BH00_YERET|nr:MULTISPECIES: VasL domain-containing protein [Yersinia]ANI28415.1 membrane protein [Yersinia entomophaga]OWF85060.1 hypothetical protein B4914_18055 [Yersinia entomophaga]
MSDNKQGLVIRTGGDPRQWPEFTAIREEINKANHPSQPQVNWRLIESLALTLFRSNGVDLQTGVYYTLARTQLNGLTGFTEGCELLASLIVSEWDRLWPEKPLARIEMLEWFTARLCHLLRQQVFSSEDLRLIYRAERALQLMIDKLQQVQLSRVPRIENMLYLMQNTAKKLERATEAAAPSIQAYQMPPLVYLTASDDAPSSREVPPAPPQPQHDDLEHARVQVRFVPTKRMSALRGFNLGIGFSLLIAAGVYLMQVRPMAQQLAAVAAEPEGSALLWLHQPELETYGEQMDRLAKRSPLEVLGGPDALMKTAQQLWPADARQTGVSQRWQEQLQARMGSNQDSAHYYQAKMGVQQLSEKLLEQEKQKGSLTISYLKTALYRIQNNLNSEIPLEELLRQFSAQREQKKGVSPVLIKQIDDRFDALLSRYHQLTVQTEPAH